MSSWVQNNKNLTRRSLKGYRMSVKGMCRPICMLSMASDLNYEQAVWTQYESSESLACVHWVITFQVDTCRGKQVAFDLGLFFPKHDCEQRCRGMYHDASKPVLLHSCFLRITRMDMIKVLCLRQDIGFFPVSIVTIHNASCLSLPIHRAIQERNHQPKHSRHQLVLGRVTLSVWAWLMGPVQSLKVPSNQMVVQCEVISTVMSHFNVSYRKLIIICDFISLLV